MSFTAHSRGEAHDARSTSTIPRPASAADDPRLGQLLGSALKEGKKARVSLIGFAVDTGIVRNGGRAGAADGPLAIREQFARLCPDPDLPESFSELVRHTRDLGDVVSSGDLERDQAELAELVARELAADSFVIVLGGGHETTYGHFLGYVREGSTVAIHNLDAHPDVRPLAEGLGHSGSPFRQALEHRLLLPASATAWRGYSPPPAWRVICST